MIDLKDNTFLREIPKNLLKDKKVVNLAKAIQKALDERTEWLNKINYTINLENLEEEVLDHILWEKHIGWNEGLALATTKEQKINLINNAVELHRHKGTPYAVEQVLKAIGINGVVSEWFEYDGDPYFFRIELEKSLSSDDELKILIDMVHSMKNERSWLENITIRRKLESPLYFTGLISTRNKIEITPASIKMPNLDKSTYYAGFISTRTITTIQGVQ